MSAVASTAPVEVSNGTSVTLQLHRVTRQPWGTLQWASSAGGFVHWTQTFLSSAVSHRPARGMYRCRTCAPPVDASPLQGDLACSLQCARDSNAAAVPHVMGPAATHTLLVAAVLFCMLLYAAGASPARLGLGRACRSFDDHNAGLALNWSRSPWTATADGHLHGTAEDRTPGGAATDWAGPFPGAGAPGADGTLALNATPAFRPNRTLAVFIAGMRSRFILDSTLERVIRQCTCDGFVVHVYLSLVGFQGRGVARDWMGEVLEPDPATRDMAHDEFDAHVRDGIVRAGGHLVYHRHSRRKESLAPIPNVWTLRSRLTQYSPSANDPSGHNVLRLWRTRETMWNASLEMERMHCAKYTFVLWQRDDTYWGWPLQLAQFEANRTVYSRDCHTFEGINDKVRSVGRADRNPRNPRPRVPCSWAGGGKGRRGAFKEAP